jgi:hypothetical protein
MIDFSIANACEYDFLGDWLSANTPLFDEHLGRLSDRPRRLLGIGCYEGRSTIPSGIRAAKAS